MATPLVGLLLQTTDPNTIREQPTPPASTTSHVFMVIAIVLLIVGFVLAGRLVVRSMMGKPRDRHEL